jgi:hypothetical protein
MNTYNDPFYFALPSGTSLGAARRAVAHIEQGFGVRGRVEVVRKELAFTLLRIVGNAA